ncbi:hypothetical protein U9M48_040663 [Paspalum notatum var. saurae]|uniref:Dirigent protein n=1 Tax=Paspalum notatum var. saurae TaxID=547442 RepID=A0AAQ3UNL1_PASNO
MATSSISYWMFRFLVLPTILLGMASLPEKTASQPLTWPCACIQQNETRLHMYLHQFPAWPNVANPNEVGVIGSSQPLGFGTMYVDDWILTNGPNPNEKIVGRAQGFHIQSGQTSTSWYNSHIFEFQDDWYAGSTLEVLGFITNSTGELSIMGGTGKFPNAHGTIKFTVTTTNNVSTKELDIDVFYTPKPPSVAKGVAIGQINK